MHEVAARTIRTSSVSTFRYAGEARALPQIKLGSHPVRRAFGAGVVPIWSRPMVYLARITALLSPIKEPVR